METSEIIYLIIKAIKHIKSKRLFNSERGFQGELKSRLDKAFTDKAIFPDKTIVEEEHQKVLLRHGITHRPDIIIHVPFEDGFTCNRKEGNFVVFELKLNGTKSEVMEALQKLNNYIKILKYSLAIFINIGKEESFIDLVRNPKIHILNVLKERDTVRIIHSYLKNGESMSEIAS